MLGGGGGTWDFAETVNDLISSSLVFSIQLQRRLAVGARAAFFLALKSARCLHYI